MCDAFKIGGPGHIVMIDECMLSKCKYNRGKLTQQLWIFGMIDSVTKIFVIQFVQDRKRTTLVPIIKKYCAPGTEIWSDQWRAYETLPEIPEFNFIHKTVNHSVNFKDPITGVCTNRIEGLWGSLRRFYRHKSTSSAINRHNISSYLDEFQWRQFWHFPHRVGESLELLLMHLGEWQGVD